MHDERDDDLPPYDRPGVAPLWRLIAIFSLLAAGGLLFLVLVLLVSLVQQGSVSTVNNGWAMAQPMAVPAAAGADVAAGDDALEQGNLPYPVRQDLRPDGTFPLPGDPGLPPEKLVPSPRQEFRQAAARIVWTNTDPMAPDRVLVSPDGVNMAFTSEDGLMAGGVGVPELIGDNGPAGRARFGRMPPGGMGGAAMAGAGRGLRPTGEHPRAALCGWSLTDPSRVFWSDPSGRILSYTPETAQVARSRARAEFALPLAAAPGDPDFLLAVRLVPRPKGDSKGPQAARDLTELAALDAAGAAVPHPGLGKTIREDELVTPALSPDGKRLALVEGKADPDKGARRWRAVVYNLENGTEVCSGPTAARYAGVCWTPDGKALVYARSQAPAPADHLPSMPKDACDLYRFDVETKKETRLSRGGGFTSPSVSKAGELFFLSQTPQEGALPLVELLSMMLKATDDFLKDQEDAASSRVKRWRKLADAALKESGVPANADGRTLSPDLLKKLADAIDHQAAQAGGDAPQDRAALARQRDEIVALGLTPQVEARFVLLLGAAEGEYLRGQAKGSSWLLGKGALDTVVTGENPFAVAFNPFRLLGPREAGKPGAPPSLAEVLFRAEGRPLILSNDPAAAREALDKRIDPDLARGTVLLQNDKGDRVLLDLMNRHAGNYFLMRQVGLLLQQYGRSKALAVLLKPLCDQLDGGGLTLPRDARLYNLMGVILFDTSPDRAITAFQDALRCDLKYGPAFLNLAQAYEVSKRTQDARLTLRRYLKLFPDGELADDARRRLRIAGDDNGP